MKRITKLMRLMKKPSPSSRYSSLQLALAILFMSFCVSPLLGAGQNASAVTAVDVGLILDSEDMVGKISRTCISMALEDFYASHPSYATMIVLHSRDSKGDVVEAASAAIDLMKNVRVRAILGPQRSTQAGFVINIGNKTQVPILSPATSPSLSPVENPYFIRVAQNGDSQVAALTALVEAFGWREVVLIYEDTEYGSSIVPNLTYALLGINTQVRNRNPLSPSATDDRILEELYKLKTMQTRVFVVHILPSLASRLFLKAKEAGMMDKGYAWIITDGLTNLLDFVDSKAKGSMQGVLGVKPHVPESNYELQNFTERWRKKFRQENPDVDRFELNVYGLWAYDTVTALAMAVERSAGSIAQSQFKKQDVAENINITDLSAIGTSEAGPRLLQSIQDIISFKGLSGDFHLVDGQLQSSTFEIINVIGKEGRKIGFWTPEYGISKDLPASGHKSTYPTNADDLRATIWPGESHEIPKGWEIPTGEKKLRVGVPVKGGFREFIEVNQDPQTNATIPRGFCADVFKEIMDNQLPYAVPYEFRPFGISEGENATDYDQLVKQIYLGKFDAVVGDITIEEDRTNYVDFTLPYTESGVAIIVPIEDDGRNKAWIFMKPLTPQLWITTGAFFIFTGFVVWVLEHRINTEFRGPPHKQVGMILWFSFSTLVFAHKERVISNLTRFVVVVWVFVVLVLTSSYTANLSSMLTVQNLRSSVTDISYLLKSQENVGYQTGSFVPGLLESKGFQPSRLKSYSTFEDYDQALSKGSKNGGVAAIVDELPYISLFLSKYCTKYTMVQTTYKTAGFGFAFPRGSPLVRDFSRGILNLTEGEMLSQIQRRWFGDEANCQEQSGTKVISGSLKLDSFLGLFVIAGVSSFLALVIFLFIFLHDNSDLLDSKDSIWQKLVTIANTFDKKKENLSNTASEETKSTEERTEAVADQQDGVVLTDCPPSPAISIFHRDAGIFGQDEGFSTTEPGSPSYGSPRYLSIEIVES